MLKKLRNPRAIFGIVYAIFFAAYIFIGLQPAEATSYKISGQIEIPSINLKSKITTLSLENQKLNIPESIVGEFYSNKNRVLLMGHSSTVFSNLDNVKLGDQVKYDKEIYVVKDIKSLKKEDVKMTELLKKTDKASIVLMTCSGEQYNNNDASHRLIITADKAELAYKGGE